MCGIAGFVGQSSIEDLRGMNAALAHGGPYDDRTWALQSTRVFLGVRLLSIVNIGGVQPMWTPDGELGSVFNGEIYNHMELCAELAAQGCLFQSVGLHGYRVWGPDFTHRLNGMWAFAHYDRRAGRLFCSRDRFVKTPFFYTLQNGTFTFAFELSAIVAHQAVATFVSRRSLQKYFAYGYIPAPHSIYERIHKLPDGHSLIFDLASQRVSIDQFVGAVAAEMGYRADVLACTRDDDGFAKIAPHLATDFDAADPEIAVTHAALFPRRGDLA